MNDARGRGGVGDGDDDDCFVFEISEELLASTRGFGFGLRRDATRMGTDELGMFDDDDDVGGYF